MRIDVQPDEDVDPNQMEEESKIARGPRTNYEFSSAAASSPNNVRRETGVVQGSIMDNKSSVPFVS